MRRRLLASEHRQQIKAFAAAAACSPLWGSWTGRLLARQGDGERRTFRAGGSATHHCPRTVHKRGSRHHTTGARGQQGGHAQARY